MNRRNFLKFLGALPALRIPTLSDDSDLPLPIPEPIPANENWARLDSLGIMVGDPVYVDDNNRLIFTPNETQHPVGIVMSTSSDDTALVSIGAGIFEFPVK